MNTEWVALSATGPDIVHDEDGVPIEWTILSVGDTPLCQEGRDGIIRLSSEDIDNILAYQEKKGEQIPVDSEHYLWALANKKNLDEAETARMFPQGVAALGFGSLSRSDDKLRIRVSWTPTAHEMLKEKIYKYFSPVIRGLKKGPLRVTSVAMTNLPAIDNLDALAARSETNNGKAPLNMEKLEKAIGHLLGKDTVALSAESNELDQLAGEIEQKANALSVLDQVTKLLELPPDATPEQIIAALNAELEKAKTAVENQAKLDELAATAEREEHARLVAKGRAERKIVDADMDYVNSLDSKALCAYLDHAAPKVPAPLPKEAGRKPDQDAIVLTAEDKAACRRLNISEERFLTEKTERAK